MNATRPVIHVEKVNGNGGTAWDRIKVGDRFVSCFKTYSSEIYVKMNDDYYIEVHKGFGEVRVNTFKVACPEFKESLSIVYDHITLTFK